jgi:phage terminase Nu1 subunit (DNA packaging protein)
MNRRRRRLSRAQADMQSLRQRVRQATTADLRVERDAATGDGELRDRPTNLT